MPQAPLPVVVNRSGGTAAALGAKLEATLRQSFGRTIDLQLVDGPDVPRALGRVAGAGRVVVGGGDGTLGSAAGLLAQAGSAMAILPLGTRNHLAGQLGIPSDLAQAARLAVEGTTTRIDLGRVGERVFVNNASLGLYARLVRNREALAAPKWLANLPAAWHVLRHLRVRRMELRVDGAARQVVTPLLFVGNNRYALSVTSAMLSTPE